MVSQSIEQFETNSVHFHSGLTQKQLTGEIPNTYTYLTIPA